MATEAAAILFGGTLRSTHLRDAIGLPALALPMNGTHSLADLWANCLTSTTPAACVRIVMNTDEDVQSVLDLSASHNEGGDGLLVGQADPAAWRGAGGILFDVTRDLPSDAIVFVAEGHRLPPATVTPILEALERDASIGGVVGVCGIDQPAGVYAFRRSAIDEVQSVGYCDLKEQMLPMLTKAGHRLVTARIGDRASQRIHDRRTFLDAVHAHANAVHELVSVSRAATVADDVLVDGYCTVSEGAIVENRCVLHNCVIAAGATIGAGAVISNSIIGPGAIVEPNRRVISTVEAERAMVLEHRGPVSKKQSVVEGI
ncbi:MAG: hypothetical protein AAF432_06475 [Planctomycetota bacterium]